MPNVFSSLFYGTVPQLPAPNPDQEWTLHQQVLTETGPGSILQDFQTLLEVVGLDGVEIGSTNYFCPTVLKALNARLSRSACLNPKRPTQKAYPYIHGLYLLLRASGLGQIGCNGKQRVLKVDAIALRSWSQLNSTERYFNLLEAWLIWGNDEILGEPLNLCRRFFDYLGRCLILWQYIPEAGMALPNSADQRQLAEFLGLHNLALLELFGLLSVQTSTSKAGRWQVEGLARSTWGKALFPFLSVWVERQLRQLDDAEQKEAQLELQAATQRGELFGKWRSLFQPFFPEWQQNLSLSPHEFQDGVYIFKVSLCSIWRRIAIPATCNMDDLSYTILKSVDFDEHHLYCFSFKNRFGWTFRINHPFLEEAPFSHRFRVGDLPLQRSATLTYLFDFDEHWEFDVRLERIEPANPNLTRAEILECHGEAPAQYLQAEEVENVLMRNG